MKAMKRYPHVLTQKEIIRLLRHRVYRVDANTGMVYGPANKPVTPFMAYDCGREKPYLFVRLYSNNKRKAISVSKLVWMSVTYQPVPPKFEIHHADNDPGHNWWSNLICLHKEDHKKMHENDAPF